MNLGGMVKRSLAAILVLALAIILVGKTGIGATPETSAIQFRDVTQTAGIRFLHNNGAFGKKFLPETMGPGVAFIDYDNDGWPDIFLVNGMHWPGHVQKHSTPKLYHNNHNGTFTDVTHKAGLDIELFGMGVAVGDYDNDGYDDLFVTAYGQSHLFHNNGNGTFTNVTQKAGLQGPKEFSTSAAWVDYDNDGHLDLVVGNYVQSTPPTTITPASPACSSPISRTRWFRSITTKAKGSSSTKRRARKSAAPRCSRSASGASSLTTISMAGPTFLSTTATLMRTFSACRPT